MAANYNHDVIYGKTEDGTVVPLQVDEDGVLQSSATLTGGGDASAANQATEITKLTAIDGHVDGLEASATSIDGKTPALGQAAMAASTPVVIASNQSTLPVTPAAGEAHLGEVGGKTVKPIATLTRPTPDTTTYAAGDVWADSASAPTQAAITGCARINNGSGVIINGLLIDSASQALKLLPEIWIFDTALTPDNDNAVFTPTDAELLTLVAILTFSQTGFVGDATSGAGGNVVFLSDPVNRGFVCTGGGTSLYWVPVVRNAYIPLAAETLSLRLTIEQN